MIAQLRIYTINRNQMDAWVQCFKDPLLPMMQDHGMKIESFWVNPQSNEFIWVRTFENEDDLKAKEASFYGSAEWQQARDFIASHVAKAEVRLIQPVSLD